MVHQPLRVLVSLLSKSLFFTHLAQIIVNSRNQQHKLHPQYDVPTSIADRLCSWSSSNSNWSLCQVSCARRLAFNKTRLCPIARSIPSVDGWQPRWNEREEWNHVLDASTRQGISQPEVPTFSKHPIHTFLNSEAQFRIVVEIGGGSVACAASTVVAASAQGQKEPRYAPSVSAGIHGSTEYGKLSMSAHSPRIALCSTRSDSAYAGSRRPGSVVLRAKARNRF